MVFDDGSQKLSFSGAELLQRIDHAVEEFRKSKLSFADGVDLLCHMEAVTCHMWILLIFCAGRTKSHEVSRYLLNIFSTMAKGLIETRSSDALKRWLTIYIWSFNITTVSSSNE